MDMRAQKWDASLGQVQLYFSLQQLGRLPHRRCPLLILAPTGRKTLAVWGGRLATVGFPTWEDPVLPPHKRAKWKDSHEEQHHGQLGEMEKAY